MPDVMQTDYPKFDMLGLLLGGRSYASNWYTGRDRLRLAENMEARDEAKRGAFAEGLLSSPEFQQYEENPYDRRAQFGLWGAMAGGPEAFTNLGNQILSNNLQQVYGREATVLEDQLARARITATADEQLRVDQTRRDRDAAQRKQMMGYLYGTPESGGGDETGRPHMQTTAMRNYAFDQAFPDQRPDNYDVVPMENGQMGFRPAVGTKEFREGMGKIYSVRNSLENISALRNGLASGKMTGAEYAATRTNLLLDVKDAAGLGALQEADLALLEEMLPRKWEGYGKSLLFGQVQEKLRVMSEQWARKYRDETANFLLPVDETWMTRMVEPGTPTSAPPSGSASPGLLERRERLEQMQRERLPDRQRRANARRIGGELGSRAGGSLFDMSEEEAMEEMNRRLEERRRR